MTDPLDVDLQDDELNAEIRLTVDLMVAAAESTSVLDQGRIDRILGVHPSAGLPAQRCSL
jgi:hypothetical protein